MILEGGISKNYTQNWDKNGNIYYTDENGQVVDFKVNPFAKLANKVKATATNIGDWINETNPNSEAYKQKVSAIAGLETLPLGLGSFATQGIARGLTPYVGRKIAQNMAQGIGSGVAGGAVTGGLEAGLNDRNIAIGGLQGATVGGLLGGLGGYGLGKVAQKLNTQTAWHGSPYKFDKFSNEAIGTGEGAQAHGYGHYVAKSKDVAKGYAERLSEGIPTFYKDGKRISPDDALSIYYSKDEIVPTFSGFDKVLDYDPKTRTVTGQAIKKINNEWVIDRNYPNPRKYWAYPDKEGIKEINKILKSRGYKVEQGNLYKLSIPKDDVMLREGATFAEQPIKVQNAIREMIKENPELSEFIDTRTSDELFDLTEKAIGKQGKNIMKDIFQAELLGDENKIMNAWDRYNAFEQKNGITSDIFNPDIVYGYLNNYKRDGVDDVGKIFANQHSNTNLYKYLEDEKNFNKRLYDKGIKGISYNGGIDGEANVIFNPDDIDIIPYYDNPTSFKEKFINLLNR